MWFTSDFDATIEARKGRWKEKSIHEIRWVDFITALGVTRSKEPFLPTRHYECPHHIM
ncbi:hypothetical protein BJX70DRAFT_357569 [Aspergillus crustosus]